MLRFLVIFLLMMGPIYADLFEQYEEDINLEMCGSADHRFDPSSNECIYCAQRLVYNKEKNQCEGTLNVLGKCYGEHHYHAATQECMFCAKGFSFDENLRMCSEASEAPKKQ